MLLFIKMQLQFLINSLNYSRRYILNARTLPSCHLPATVSTKYKLQFHVHIIDGCPSAVFLNSTILNHLKYQIIIFQKKRYKKYNFNI